MQNISNILNRYQVNIESAAEYIKSQEKEGHRLIKFQVQQVQVPNSKNKFVKRKVYVLGFAPEGLQPIHIQHKKAMSAFKTALRNHTYGFAKPSCARKLTYE